MKSEECRSCGSKALTLVYDFGPQPLAGYFPTRPDSEVPANRYALDLTQCRTCGLLQVTNLPPIEDVFHADYRYSSSTVPDLVRHFEGYAEYLAARLPAGASVLEFGCNDGVLLERLARRGFDCTGVDASDNVASLARAKGLDVRTGFLTEAFVAEQNLTGRFDAVTCSNVFAHIDDLRGTMAAVRALLKPGGVFFVEVHDGDVLAREAQFDTIYHEHLTYFTASTLRRLTEAEGFAFAACERTPMHGGGLRFSATLRAAGAAATAPESVALIDGAAFAETIRRCREDLARLQAEHGPLYGYGAAGRSQMFINMAGGEGRFAAVFDDSAFRQDRYIVGTDIPIRSYSGERGGCCVILAWNYAPTIAARVAGSFDKVVTLLPDYREW
jgi:SAM-dependent methyltransferase